MRYISGQPTLDCIQLFNVDVITYSNADTGLANLCLRKRHQAEVDLTVIEKCIDVFIFECALMNIIKVRTEQLMIEFLLIFFIKICEFLILKKPCIA